MERSAPYALIAAFVLAGLAVGAGLLVWLNDYDPGRRTTTYAVVFDDVSGLSLASEVRYNGLPVGEVATMALDPAGSGLIRVEIEVLEEVPLREGAVARLSTQGVTGVAIVALEGGDPRAGPLPEGPEGMPMLASGRGAVETLADEAPALLEEARALVADLRAFATPENALRVGRVLADLEQGAVGLGEIGALAEDLGGIGRALAPALRGLPDTLASVRGAADEAEALATSVRGTVEDRGPVLASAVEGALAEVTAAADSGRARLTEAAPAIEAATEAGRSLNALLSEARNAIAVAGAAIGDTRPVLSDAGAAARSLREDLPAALADLRASTEAVRTVAEVSFPALADEAQATFQAATRTAETLGTEVAALGTVARARLDESRFVLETFGAAAQAVEGASTEVEATVSSVAPAAGRLAATAEVVAAEIGPLVTGANGLIGEARDATAAAQTVLGRADGVMSDLGRAPPELNRALRGIAAAADALERLAQRLERDPSRLLWGR